MSFWKDDAAAIVKTVVIGGALVALAVTGWVLWHRYSAGPMVDSYKACVDAGNLVQTSYPSVCVTKEGKRFVGPSDGNMQPPAEGAVPK
jgi:hypothetical protein